MSARVGSSSRTEHGQSRRSEVVRADPVHRVGDELVEQLDHILIARLWSVRGRLASVPVEDVVLVRWEFEQDGHAAQRGGQCAGRTMGALAARGGVRVSTGGTIGWS